MGCFSLEEPVYVEKQWSHMEFRQPFQDTYIVVTAGKENTYYFYIFSTACWFYTDYNWFISYGVADSYF